MKLLKFYTDSFRGLSPESWMLALVMLINRSGSMVLPFLGVYMTDQLHFSIQSAGLVLSLFGTGSVVGSWLGGMATDRFGEFRVQAFSLLLSVPLFCIIPLFRTEIGLAAIMFVLSSVSEAFRPANSVAITRYARKENLTRVFSLNRMAVNLGFSIGPAMGGILSAFSYDLLFYTNAAAALLAAVTYIAFFRKRTYRNTETKQENTRKTVQQSPYKDVKFIIFCVACMIFSVCFFQFLNTLTIFYKEVAELSQKQIGFLLGYSGFIIVLMEMLLVQMAERNFPLKVTMFLGTLLCGISFALLRFDHSLAVLIISMTILCIGEIWTLPFMATITAMRSGIHNKGAYMGLLGIAFSISFMITPFVGTSVAEKLGFNVLWISTALIFTLVAIAFYFIVPWMIGKDEKKN